MKKYYQYFYLLYTIFNIYTNGSGEPFAIKHTRKLIKTITENNTKAQFGIFTNGILFNEENISQLGLLGRIKEV